MKYPKDRYLLSRTKIVHMDDNIQIPDVKKDLNDNSSTDLRKKTLPKSGKLPLIFGDGNKKRKMLKKKKKSTNPISEYKKKPLGEEDIEKVPSTNSVPYLHKKGLSAHSPNKIKFRSSSSSESKNEDFGRDFGILGISEKEDDLGSDISDYDEDEESIESSTLAFRTYKELIEEQLKAMALCHDAFVDSGSKSYKFYHSTSPDEIAILNGIRDIGVEFMGDEGDSRIVKFFKKNLNF